VLTAEGEQIVVTEHDLESGSERTLSTTLPEGSSRSISATILNLSLYADGTFPVSANGRYVTATVILEGDDFVPTPAIIDLQSGTIMTPGTLHLMPQGWSANGHYLLIRTNATPSYTDPIVTYIYDFSSGGEPTVTTLPEHTILAGWVAGTNRIVFKLDLPTISPSPLVLVDVESGDQIILADHVSNILYVGR
jgi:hypothetical protein